MDVFVVGALGRSGMGVWSGRRINSPWISTRLTCLQTAVRLVMRPVHCLKSCLRHLKHQAPVGS
jgi:hypothetical protein